MPHLQEVKQGELRGNRNPETGSSPEACQGSRKSVGGEQQTDTLKGQPFDVEGVDSSYYSLRISKLDRCRTESPFYG